MKQSFLSEKDKALKKLQRYCAYQDRCHQEVRNKLLTLKIYGEDLEDIIVQLIQDNFLNEERFARSYARGKFRIKKWGRIRIRQELKKRSISTYCIKKAMEEIEENTYLETLQEILEKRKSQIKETRKLAIKTALVKYAIGRGYESTKVWKIVNEIVT